MFNAKTIGYVANTVLSDVYTVANASTVTLIQATNRTSSAVSLNVVFYSNATSSNFDLANSLTLPANSSLSLTNEKMFLNAGDKIRASATTSNAVAFVLSYVENPQ